MSGLRSRSRASAAPEIASPAPLRSSTSTGPSPAPISTSPCSTACRGHRARPPGRRPRGQCRARAARRAWPSACSRRRASRQRRGARPGSRRAARRRRDGRPARRRAHRSRSRPARRARASARRARGAIAAARERLRLVQVRRHHGRERKQPRRRARRPRRPRSSLAPELATITGSTTSGTRVLGEEVRRPSRSTAREKSIPVFAASTPMSSNTASSCARDEPRRQLVDGRDAERVLRRQRDDRGHAVAARGGERLQVGLDAGAAARVGATRSSVRVECHVAPFAGMTRIRFGGCVLSPATRHPGRPRLPIGGGMAVEVGALGRSAPGEELALHSRSRACRGTRAAARRFPTTCTRACATRSAARRRSTRTRREAWDAARRGEHVIVTTGTASGKTLAFNLPVLDALARDPKHRALYLYPTKALAQDQARTLAALKRPRMRAAIYDGDTPGRAALADPQLGEPHPHEPGHAPRRRPPAPRPLGRRALEPPLRRRRRGARLPRRLRLARRRTSCAACAGSRASTAPSRSSCSPPRRSRTRASLRVAARRRRRPSSATDGAPRAERTIALWNPPLLDEELGQRASALGEASRLLAALVERGLRTICFAKSRRAAELIHRFTADRLEPRPRRGSRRTAPGTRPRSGARSSGASSRASCSA